MNDTTTSPATLPDPTTAAATGPGTPLPPIPSARTGWLLPATPAETAFVVLDLENLLYPCFTDAPKGRRATITPGIIERFAALAAVVAGGRRRVVAVGDHRLLPHLMGPAARHGIRLVPTRPGPDTADLECIRWLTTGLPTGCTQVWIGSGDGLFALTARRLTAQGVTVRLLTGSGTVSATLRAATTPPVGYPTDTTTAVAA